MSQLRHTGESRECLLQARQAWTGASSAHANRTAVLHEPANGGCTVLGTWVPYIPIIFYTCSPVVQKLKGCGSCHPHHGGQAFTQLCCVSGNALVWVVNSWLLLLLLLLPLVVELRCSRQSLALLPKRICRLLHVPPASCPLLLPRLRLLLAWALPPLLPQLQKVVGVLPLAVAAVQVAGQPLAPCQRQPLCQKQMEVGRQEASELRA